MFKKLLAVLVVSFVLVGCGDNSPTVNTSSETDFQTSVKGISSTLEGEDKNNFDKALGQALIASGMESGGDDTKFWEILKEKLDGKTAQEIIKEYANK